MTSTPSGAPRDASASPSGRDFGPSFPEWAEPPAGAPIRQGDVIAAVQESDSLWHQMLVVITADCDLAKSKHGGALTCVPVLRLEDYLILFRYEKLRDSLVARLVDSILGALHSAEASGLVPNISHSRMRQWISEAEVPDIVGALSNIAIPAGAQDHMRLAGSLLVDEPQGLSSAIEFLAKAKVALGDFKDIDRARKGTASDLASSLMSLPGDVLLLNEVSAAHVEGYTVYLRRAFEVPDSSVVTSFSRIPHDARYVRISRLRSPYIYALTQQFGAVFSAIGLPTLYEQARDSIGARIKAGEY